MWIYVIMFIILILLIFIIVMYNSFIKLNNKVNEAFATMDVYLKKRWDLVPNLIEIVKGYTSHEIETLESMIDLRNSAYEHISAAEKISANERLANGLSKIMMLAEAYPDLKANQNFLDLSSKLTTVEEDIANARKYYNAVVRLFNDKVQMFPSNLLARILGYHEKQMFEAGTAERENISIKM